MAKKNIDYAATMVSGASKIFGGTKDNSASAPDPVIPTRVRVTLDNLVTYENNPRKKRNPKYYEIKESIRNQGLDHAPNVTRQSPSDPYMIKDGGNTRLQILNELYQEAKDDPEQDEQRYFVIDCMFHPYTSDIDILAGHMIENEMRGHTLFIERAIAAAQFRDFFQQDEEKPLSVNKLSKLICVKGWTINQSNLNQMIYAIDQLLPTIPNALWEGLGIDRVKKVRKLITDGEKLWTALAKEDDPEYSQVWQAAFSALDQQELFDYDEALIGLEKAIAKAFECELPHIQAELQSISQGGKPPTERPVSGFVSHPPADSSTESTASVTPIRGGASDTPSPQKSAPVAQQATTADTQQSQPSDAITGHQMVPQEPVEVIGGRAHPAPEQLPNGVDMPPGVEDAMTAKMTLPQDHPMDWYRPNTQDYVYPNSALNRRHARQQGDGEALPIDAMLLLPFEQFICEWDYHGGNAVTRIRILKQRLESDAFLMLQRWALDDAINYFNDDQVLNDPLAPPFLFYETAARRVIEKFINCQDNFYQYRNYQDPEVHLRWRQLGLLCYIADVLSYCMDDFAWNNPSTDFIAFPFANLIDEKVLRMARSKISEIRALGSCPCSEDIFKDTAFFMGSIDACMGMIMHWRIVYTEQEGYLSHGFPID